MSKIGTVLPFFTVEFGMGSNMLQLNPSKTECLCVLETSSKTRHEQHDLIHQEQRYVTKYH